MKTKLTAAVVLMLTTGLLTGCSTQPAPNYVTPPATAKYGTGIQVTKPINTKVMARETVIAAVLSKVGTFDTAAHQQALSYDNLRGSSFDLGANSPAFVTGGRTTVKCAPGKTQGTDIGQGFYLVGDTFLLPAAGHTLGVQKTLTGVKAAAKTVAVGAVTKVTADGSKKADAYEFKVKSGDRIRITVYENNTVVTGIRVSTVLGATKCYSLNGLPTTTAETVKMWKTQISALS